MVKVLNKNDRLNREEFVKEAAMLARIRHPLIVQFFGACVDPQRLCLVLRYIRKGTAENLLIAKKHWPSLTNLEHQRKVFQIAVDVAAACSFLHTESPPIIHRYVTRFIFLPQLY